MLPTSSSRLPIRMTRTGSSGKKRRRLRPGICSILVRSWEVVRDENHKIVNSVKEEPTSSPRRRSRVRQSLSGPRPPMACVVTKTFRLFPEYRWKTRSHDQVRGPR